MRPPTAALAVAALLATAHAQAPAPAPAAAAAVCPAGIAPAKNHYTLVVGPATMKKSSGETWPALAYNGSIVGPVLRAVDGEEVSIDVVNTLEEGEVERVVGVEGGFEGRARWPHVGQKEAWAATRGRRR
jgi:FtsP/CotA-like multicopper oxidase with cupredoxin domain